MEISERTVLRNWMEQYNSYLKFDYMVVWSPDPPIPEILEAPQIELVWHRRLERNKSLFRYGLAWTVYDWVGLRMSEPIPQALSCCISTHRLGE